MTSLRLHLFLIACSAAILSACGGKGATGSTSPSVITQNAAPVARVVSSVTLVTENQPFTLDASTSSDAEGADLSYTWTQISGPAVTLPSEQNEFLNLTAPKVSGDSDITFQVSVSDGNSSRTASVSVGVDKLTPVQTVSKPSSFYNGKNLDKIAGLVSNDAGYTVFWSGDFEDDVRATSSQFFSADGEAQGNQIDGELFTSSDVDGVSIVNILKHGDDVLYDLSVYKYIEGEFTTIETYGATALGIVDGLKNITGREFGLGEHTMGYGGASRVGEDQVVIANTFKENDALGTIVLNNGRQVAFSFYRVEANIIENNGTAISTILSEANENFKFQADVTALTQNTYLAIWLQIDALDEIDSPGEFTRIYGQRANLDGTLIGEPFVITQQPNSTKFGLDVTQFEDGKVLVTWGEISRGNGGDKTIIKGRVLSPEMTFLTPDFQIGPDENASASYAHSTVLPNNQILISWASNMRVDEDIIEVVKAVAISSDGSFGSNVFTIATGDPAQDAGGIMSTRVGDEKVVLGWTAESPDDPNEDIGYTLGFYPFGKSN